MKLSGKSWRGLKILPDGPPRPRRSTGPSAGASKADAAIGTLCLHCRAAGLPDPVREFWFARPRKWRFDLAWPDPHHMIAVELEGLVFPPAPRWNEATEHRLSGRHVSVTGYLADLTKYAEAFALGWAVLRISHKDIESGQALQWIERRLRGADDRRPEIHGPGIP